MDKAILHHLIQLLSQHRCVPYKWPSNFHSASPLEENENEKLKAKWRGGTHLHVPCSDTSVGRCGVENWTFDHESSNPIRVARKLHRLWVWIVRLCRIDVEEFHLVVECEEQLT